MIDLKVPQFANEADEAQWWFDNDPAVSAKFQKAATEGNLRRGGAAGLLAEQARRSHQPLPSTTIRLDPEDIAKARIQAADRGLRYQTYLKMIIHQALRDAKAKAETAASAD